MIRHLMIFAFVALLAPEAARAQVPEIVKEGQAVVLNSKEFTLRSQALGGREVVVQVTWPLVPAPAGQKTAVAYVLDGALTLGLASDTTRMISLDGSISPSHIVAIGYPASSMMNVQNLRERDMLHAETERDGKKVGGGGGALEAFIIDELKPFIEARFPVDPARSILVGQSYGGLFAANVLVRRPDAFAGYMIGSPSLWADGTAIEAIGAIKGGGRKVFVGVGEQEDAKQMLAPTARFVEALKANSSLVVRDEVFADETHTSMRAAWISDGWRFLLAAPKPAEQ